MDTYVIRQMMHVPVQWHSLSSISGSGVKNYAAPQTLYGFPVGKETLVKSKNGETILSTQQVYLTAVDVVKIDVGDLFEIASSGVKMPVLSVMKYYREQGILDYGVVYLK